jgi:hypothetical protein
MEEKVSWGREVAKKALQWQKGFFCWISLALREIENDKAVDPEVESWIRVTLRDAQPSF